MFHQNNIILIGNSLVEQSKSLNSLKKRIINIDSFNDSDLEGENYLNPDPLGFVNDEVILIIKKLSLKKDDTLIIVSSDYDKNKNYFSILQQYGKIIGNDYNTILKLKDHVNLSKKLKKHKIKYPKRFFLKENFKKTVLIKNSFLSGGLGIKEYKSNIDIYKNEEYFEEYIEGQAYSVLFISNKNKKFKIIGINKIFNKKTTHSDFCFSGACSNVALDNSKLDYLNYIINFFVNEYNLVGINGIDFILSNDIYFLEINPRITQTCFLYNDILSNGYILAHINSILYNDLHVKERNSKKVSFFENLFSSISFNMNIDLSEFSFVSNIPKTNTSIAVGDPICTVNSCSSDEKKAKNLLLNNISLVKKQLKNIEII